MTATLNRKIYNKISRTTKEEAVQLENNSIKRRAREKKTSKSKLINKQDCLPPPPTAAKPACPPTKHPIWPVGAFRFSDGTGSVRTARLVGTRRRSLGCLALPAHTPRCRSCCLPARNNLKRAGLPTFPVSTLAKGAGEYQSPLPPTPSSYAHLRPALLSTQVKRL